MYEQIKDDLLNYLNDNNIELDEMEIETIVATIREELEDAIQTKIENFRMYIE